MFKLESHIADWRKGMLAARISSKTVEELQSHLRERIATLVAEGKNESDAFAEAAQSLGSPAMLKTEFKKLGARNCVPSLGWAAWIIFVIAFFLPAVPGYFGWQCAAISATCVSWSEFNLKNWGVILLFLMTPANLVMLVSPFFVAKLSRRPLAFKWLRAANLTAFALVWTYLTLMITNSDQVWESFHDLRLGCYLWAASFLMFSLSLFRFRARKKIYA